MYFLVNFAHYFYIPMADKLYVVPIGGLANRMRAIASGVALSQKTGKQLKVVWYKNSDLNASFKDIFKTDSLPFQVVEPGWLKYNLQFEAPRKRNFYISMLTAFLDGKKRIPQNVNGRFLSDQSEIESLASVAGEDVILQSGSIFADIDRTLVNKTFNPTLEVLKRKEEILNGKRPKASLQIRRTDNSKSISHSPLEAFDEVASTLVGQFEDIEIFLATDDEDTKHYFSSHYPKNIIHNPATASRNSREGIIDAAAELYIMSETDHIYGSYWSSFSEIASLIGGNTLTVIKK